MIRADGFPFFSRLWFLLASVVVDKVSVVKEYIDVVHQVLAGIANSSMAGLARPHSSTPDTSKTLKHVIQRNAE
jgi:hypothetical protein